MKYDTIIIGAGVAGLVSALKLSCQGKKVLLLERQPIPGGYVTVFKRKGFIFESTLHCVDSLAEDGEVREFLKETGVDEKIEYSPLKNFARVIYPEHDFIADFNRDNFKAYLTKSFPAEARNIGNFFIDIDKFFSQFDNFCNSELPLWLKLLLSPFIYPSIVKISCLSAKQLIARHIKDEKLAAIISDIWRFSGLPPARLGAFYFLLTLRGYYYEPTAYIKGGFISLFEAMVDEIKKAGSEVKFNTTVKKIITHQKRAVESILTEKGEEFKARVVISNANAIDTLTKLLDDEKLKMMYGEKLGRLEKSISAVQVYLGLDVPARSMGMNEFMFSINNTYNHDEAFEHSLGGDYDKCSIEIVDHAQIDPGLVPEGKGSLLIMSFDAFSNWQGLTEDEYRIKKQNMADKLIKRAEQYLPGLSKHIEVMEVATPRTMQRFTLSPEGAIYGFAQTVAQSGINRLSEKTKVKGLFLAGAWTHPGHGVHGCFVSGMSAADLALKFLKKSGN